MYLCVEVRIRVFRSKRTITKERTRFEWQPIMRTAAASLMQQRLMGQPVSLCRSRLGIRGQLRVSKNRSRTGEVGFGWVAAVTVVEVMNIAVSEGGLFLFSSRLVGTDLGSWRQASRVKLQHKTPFLGPPVDYVPLYVGHDLPPPPQQPHSLKQTGRLSSSCWSWSLCPLWWYCWW